MHCSDQLVPSFSDVPHTTLCPAASSRYLQWVGLWGKAMLLWILDTQNNGQAEPVWAYWVANPVHALVLQPFPPDTHDISAGGAESKSATSVEVRFVQLYQDTDKVETFRLWGKKGGRKRSSASIQIHIPEERASVGVWNHAFVHVSRATSIFHLCLPPPHNLAYWRFPAYAETRYEGQLCHNLKNVLEKTTTLGLLKERLKVIHCQAGNWTLTFSFLVDILTTTGQWLCGLNRPMRIGFEASKSSSDMTFMCRRLTAYIHYPPYIRELTDKIKYPPIKSRFTGW